MVNMKRSVSVILVLALSCALFGCAREQAPAPTLLETSSTTQLASDPTQLSDPTDPTGETQPTQPSTVPTAPSQALQEGDFVRVLDYIPLAKQALAYATYDNFTGEVIYGFTDAYLRFGTVKKLMEVNQELQQYGYTLLIWDAYRPVYAQEKLYDVCPDPTYVSPPGVGNQNHCRGRAVDVTLVDLITGKELVMPTGFDDFSKLADRDYSDVPADAAFNAMLLEDVMERKGFKGYQGEWWHFNDTDDYPIEEVFDPAAV